MKTYILPVSKTFPKYHKRAGQPTEFLKKISSVLIEKNECNLPKIHTIRANYALWKKRIEEVKKGNAIIKIVTWSGRPYHSKQQAFYPLSFRDNVDIQKLEFYEDKDNVPSIKYPLVDNISQQIIETIAENDGLEYKDFKEWFKNYNLSEPMAIIHFTNFRY